MMKYDGTYELEPQRRKRESNPIENLILLVGKLSKDEYIRFRMMILMSSSIHDFKREWANE